MGILSIPKMDLELPIYLGATAEHLASGAAQLSQTSMPIGGENTNCVLAGHGGGTALCSSGILNCWKLETRL